ncbi:MAG: hypothetical protein V8R90_04940 [Eubacterium sp.]
MVADLKYIQNAGLGYQDFKTIMNQTAVRETEIKSQRQQRLKSRGWNSKVKLSASIEILSGAGMKKKEN